MSSGEFFDHGGVRFVIVGEIRVVFVGVFEDLEGEVEVLTATNHRDEGFWEEDLVPGFGLGNDGGRISRG